LLLSPVLFVNDLLLVALFIGAEDGLLAAEYDVFVVSAVYKLVSLLIYLFVDQADALHAQRVVAEDLVFDFLRLEAEKSLQGQHRVVHLQLHELADNDGDNCAQLVIAYPQLPLSEGVSACVRHDTLHEGVVADALLEEFIEVVHVVKLVEDPGLLELVDDATEEARRHLHEVRLLR